MPNPKYFKPELDTPYQIALKYPTAKQVNGFSGPELRWILSDGRAFYTPLDFAAKLEALQIKAGQQLQIEKRRRGEWFVSHLPDSQPGPRPPQKAASLFSEAGSLDAPEGLADPNSYPDRPSSQQALETALKMAVSAASEAEKHGTKIGYAVRFRPEDIRAMGITVLIGMQSGNAA